MTANALADELSPYLLQHANNPVAWLPWGEEAFAKARELDRPIFLSIGYSACHWCHVMARESFADDAVAALMNANFVNVKVDREERPDVDAVYMRAVQALTGSGGWPLTAVLTPDGRPFYGGTYFPPVATHGLPAFTTVLRSLAQAWRERRDEVEESAEAIASYLLGAEDPLRFRSAAAAAADPVDEGAPDASAAAPPPEPMSRTDGAPGGALLAALARLEADEDRLNGGFGGAPKFPPHAVIAALLGPTSPPRGRDVARRALAALLRGGVRDHLGGGLFRYSVDAGWRVPHFEKMLYDNALLLANLAGAHALAPDPQLAEAADELCAWLERELTLRLDGDAALFSALDAESVGPDGRRAEGAYYTWSSEEFARAAGEERELLAERFGVGAVGELEGRHVLRVAARLADLAATHGASEAELRRRLNAGVRRLAAAREQRPRPAVDDKVLSSWNGLMMRALALAGVGFARPEWIALALANARFLKRELYSGGRLFHVWRAGERRVEGLLEDYAYLGLGLVELYRATLEPWLLLWAGELADAVEARFGAPGGGYYNTASDAEALLTRPQGVSDAATPSENAAAAELVWWLARYRSDGDAQRRAYSAVASLAAVATAAPQAFGSTLGLLARSEAEPPELVVVGQGAAADELLRVARAHSPPDTALLHVTAADHPLADLPLLQGRLAGSSEERGATAYLCRAGACLLPARSPAALAEQLRGEPAGG